jgi:hypothetical protein
MSASEVRRSWIRLESFRDYLKVNKSNITSRVHRKTSMMHESLIKIV